MSALDVINQKIVVSKICGHFIALLLYFIWLTMRNKFYMPAMNSAKMDRLLLLG
jgi:lysophospholipid acyltransferase (LPLAT)-like uncharacterized protein